MDQLKVYKKMTMSSLKDILKTKSLPVGGNKEALIRRLMQGEGSKRDRDGDDEDSNAKRAKPAEKATLKQVAEWCQMKIPDLKFQLGERGLKKSGNKGELIVRLYTGQKMTKDEESDVMQEIFYKNDKLSKHFSKLSEEAGPGHRGNSFRLVASLLSYYPFVIKSGKQAQTLKGIGKSAGTKIQEFLTSGGESPQPEAAPVPVAVVVEEAKRAVARDVGGDAPEGKEGGDVGGGLESKVIALMSADESDMGLAVSDMAAKVGASEDDVRSIMTSLSDSGRVYSTLDENTFKLDE